MSKIELSGQVFFGLRVIEDSKSRTKSGDVLWRCECLTCGSSTTLARKFDLVRGDYQSCGCLRGKLNTANKTTHGKSRTPKYKIYTGMIERCTKPEHHSWEGYGGRGITVCDRWLEAFENFDEDMGERPSDKHSLDRIDNDQGYCKENCRWATSSEQAYNRGKRSASSSRHKNVYLNKKINRWVARVWEDGVRVYLGSYKTEDEAALAIKVHHGN